MLSIVVVSEGVVGGGVCGELCCCVLGSSCGEAMCSRVVGGSCVGSSRGSCVDVCSCAVLLSLCVCVCVLLGTVSSDPVRLWGPVVVPLVCPCGH